MIPCLILTLCPMLLGAVEQLPKTPILTTTAIIEVYDHDDFKGIVLVEKGKAPFSKALPEGKVENGETLENAVRKGMMEEVNLELVDLKQLHVDSDAITHVARAYTEPVPGDGVATAFVVPFSDIPWNELAFGHALILQGYLKTANIIR